MAIARWLFIKEDLIINIFIYSDESGVFDKVHNDYFIFGGIICIGNDTKEIWSRKYSAAEDVIRNKKGNKNKEIKASNITNEQKGKLFRSLNNCYKFGVVIKEKELLESIYYNKKGKQRYLDYAYKIAVKRALEDLVKRNLINRDEVYDIYFYVDEHQTATNGLYELRQTLEQEFKYGIHNLSYNAYYPPVFPKMHCVQVYFCNSKKKLLVRAADIVANKIYHLANENNLYKINEISNLYLTQLPKENIPLC